MADALPPFAVSEIYENQGLSVVQVNERQYQATVDLHPEAALSYLDDDDGERVTIGSGLELRQRLDEPANPIGPFTHCYNSIKDQFEDRTLHVFDIRKTSTSRALWESLKTRYDDEKRQYESEQAKKDKCDSISSIDLNSDHHDEGESKGDTRSDQSQSPSKKQEPSEDKLAAILSDALPDLVENLANVMQTTSETLRKAAQRSRGSKTSPIEDVLSGMSNIVTEIGSFGLSLLDQFNSSEAEEVPEYEVLPEDPMQASQTSEASFEENKKSEESSPIEVESSVDSLPSKASTVEPEDKPYEALHSKPSVCHFCSTCRLQCRTSTDYSSACHNCVTLGQPCSLDPAAVVPPLVAFTASHDTATPKDDSILDQDTEDAEFSRRYPPLMSLRRANTVSGLRDYFEGPTKSSIIDHGLHRHRSWAKRFPHRPIPQVLDEETKRRKGFAQDCFPSQQYTPGPGTQETRIAPVKNLLYSNRRFADIESQERNDFSSKSLENYYSEFKPYEDTPAVTSKVESPASQQITRDTFVTPESPFTESISSDLKRKSLPGAWPESAENRSASNAPVGESSGAFFNRMMRDNPSRRQNVEPDLNERLTRHRSFTRNQRNKNPFRDLNRSSTVSKADNPASRLSGPFDPMYPVLAKEARMPASALARPFSPVWEDDLGQTSSHNKDKNEKTGSLDRNGESASMYSPPPRHMRSVPNFAMVTRVSPDLDAEPSNTVSVTDQTFKSAYTAPPKSEDTPPMPFQVMFQRQGSQPDRLSTDPPSTDRPSTTPRRPVVSDKRSTSHNTIRECVKALKDMGFGLTDKDLAERLRVYAILANGNVTEAVDLIEEDREASYR